MNRMVVEINADFQTLANVPLLAHTPAARNVSRVRISSSDTWGFTMRIDLGEAGGDDGRVSWWWRGSEDAGAENASRLGAPHNNGCADCQG